MCIARLGNANCENEDRYYTFSRSDKEKWRIKITKVTQLRKIKNEMRRSNLLNSFNKSDNEFQLLGTRRFYFVRNICEGRKVFEQNSYT